MDVSGGKRAWRRDLESPISTSALATAGGLVFIGDLDPALKAFDDRDGTPRFYDVNALSNFVARPLDVLGWDPHERLVDRIVGWIGEAR
jgi:hypothetical protein